MHFTPRSLVVADKRTRGLTSARVITHNRAHAPTRLPTFFVESRQLRAQTCRLPPLLIVRVFLLLLVVRPHELGRVRDAIRTRKSQPEPKVSRSDLNASIKTTTLVLCAHNTNSILTTALTHSRLTHLHVFDPSHQRLRSRRAASSVCRRRSIRAPVSRA